MPSLPHTRWRWFALSTLLCVAVGGCSTGTLRDRDARWGERLSEKATPLPDEQFTQAVPDAAAPAQRADNSFYLPGSGRFAAARNPVVDAREQDNGDIKLNFLNANLLEVIKVILGDMLGITYMVDPRVQGTVSMQTSNALRQADLIPTLELLLRMNDAALLTDGGIYRVVPLANAMTGVRAPQLGDSSLSLPPGYHVRIVPLQHVAAEEMVQILEPFISGSNQLVRVDTQRNLLVLAASGGDMDRLLETVRVFDVDRMRGMSVAMFTPDFVDANTLGEELEKLLADPETGLMAGLVRFTVIERLNGLMVVTPRAEYLSRVRDWVKRLDRESGVAGQRLFIYRVQNGKATELADMLSQLFQPQQQELPAAEVAPGLTAATIGQLATPPQPRPTVTATNPNVPPARPTPTAAAGGDNLANGLALRNESQVRIIADEPNNALLILANTSEYRQILSALQQLDVSPMQVLVEVTIAEVTLSDDLQYGVEWFFNNKVGSSLTGVGTLDLGAAGIAGLTPGFSYALQGGGGTVNAVLNLLATESNLSIVSSPSLLVLNNQEATIQVGDEVPVSTQLQQTIDNTANVLNSIEYRDTGVLLKVKPRINAGGLVIMEVEQEASIVPTANNADPLTPRIQTRKITSTVAVNSGDTIILGGLIEDNHDLSESGLPGLHKMPVFGSLFGTKSDNKERTELLVLITPRAITHRTSALQVTEEFRRKMHSLIPVQPPVGTDAPPAAAAPPRAEATAPQSGAPASPTKPAPDAPLGAACERIGPFENEVDAQALATNLGARGVHTAIRQEVMARGTRILVQGLDDAEQAHEALTHLQQAGFDDALLYTAGPSRNSISLGRFANPANAGRVAERARALQLPGEVVESAGQEQHHWVELYRSDNSPEIDDLVQQAGGNLSNVSDCGRIAAH